MSRPTRSTAAGRAYLDLQRRARAEGRPTQELLTLYVVERWLARLAHSPYAEQFVLKGGILLAVFDARRPTADVDALARNFANDEATVVARIVAIAQPPKVFQSPTLCRRSGACISGALGQYKVSVDVAFPLISPANLATFVVDQYSAKSRTTRKISEHAGRISEA